MRDNAPVGNTCPEIDSIISLIRNMDNYNINEESELKDLNSDIRSCEILLEEIRSANSELREWGNDLHRDKEDLENENYKLQDQVSDLENTILDLQEDIKNLESELKEI